MGERAERWGAPTCQTLQTTFRRRVSQVNAIMDAHPDGDDFGVLSRSRLLLRLFQAIRSMRRAAEAECDWIEHGSEEDIAVVQHASEATLANNPCIEAAKEVFDGATTPEEELQ